MHTAFPPIMTCTPQTAKTILLPLAMALSLCLSSCTNLYYNGPQGALTGATRYLEGFGGGSEKYRHQPDNSSWWRGDGVPGTPRIVISLREQKAFFYKNGQLVGLSSISTGDENHRTPPGVFTISQKNMWHRSSQYGDYVDYNGNVVVEGVERGVDPQPPGTRYQGARMDYFMRFNRGIGMHAGYLPGYPASHGCVRMPTHMAQAFFRNVNVGTPVEVRY